MTSIVHQPFFEVGVDGLQPFLVSLALSLVALSTFSTIGRVVIGRRRGEKWTGQAFSLMATIFALVHTVVLILACNEGLGKHDGNQRPGTYELRSQLRYGMELLATAAISCAKSSTAAIVHQIVGIVHRRLRHSLLAVTVVYATFAMFAVAFQCSGSAPRYWLYTPRACGNGALAYTVVILNMITDLWLAVAALPIVWRVQTTVPKRIRVMALLGARLSVVVAETMQLISLAEFLNRSTDRPWNDAIIIRYTLITMGLSILCANLPILSSWLDNLMSGHNGVHITTVENSSRRSRILSTKGDSRTKASMSRALNPDLLHGDAESDHGSQTGILKTTAIRFDHGVIEVQTPEPRSRADVQEQYKW